jgi:Protein of unknown function (DUF3224)
MPKATGSFQITSFHEDTYEDRGDAAKLTHAWGDQAFSGAIEGEGQVHWLMSYRPDGSATYVGLQRIKGSVGGRRGSLVIDASGEFDGAASYGKWSIIRGSGTGDLEGITGSGTFEAPGGPTATYDLDYEQERSGR